MSAQVTLLEGETIGSRMRLEVKPVARAAGSWWTAVDSGEAVRTPSICSLAPDQYQPLPTFFCMIGCSCDIAAVDTGCRSVTQPGKFLAL